MSTKNVALETEIIPALAFANPLETALAANDQFDSRLLPLKAKAADLKVKTKEDYAAIGELLSEVRSIRKNEIIPLWSPFSGVIERVRDYVRQKRQAKENICNEIEAICLPKMKAYEVAEAAATAKEQKKHPEGTVAPEIPAVAGYRRSTTYPITIDDPKQLLRDLLRSYKKGDTKRVQFLQQFVMLDEKALATYARETKDPKKFNSEIPGVTCKKDGV